MLRQLAQLLLLVLQLHQLALGCHGDDASRPEGLPARARRRGGALSPWEVRLATTTLLRQEPGHFLPHDRVALLIEQILLDRRQQQGLDQLARDLDRVVADGGAAILPPEQAYSVGLTTI